MGWARGGHGATTLQTKKTKEYSYSGRFAPCDVTLLFGGNLTLVVHNSANVDCIHGVH